MIILITGTRTGVGKALAEHFLDQGHQVVGCSRKPAALDRPGYRHHDIDLTDQRAVKGMFREIRREFGHLDALVNNAGTSNMNHFMMTPEKVARDIFDLNFFAVLNCCREGAKLLQKSPEGSSAILNVSTVAVPWALDGQLVYSASKAAVEQLTRVMSKELSGFGIRVNGLGLPPVRTVLTRTLPEGMVDSLIERQAIKRMCTMADIVGPVEFLISQRSGFVTGETLFLGGVN
ncbi:SDR family NAD(P)-dependent oxidoreductase [Streptomyces eurythermus]|jgi:3-oxoacyl-[acyl-carrier protein] reductase|uniref:SDR family oxidoreductase n=1 Tax=Streptomyces achromogenes TaxID=67255 RepID=A0ABZ1KJC2_STRAH|nr:SDR family oxidoreductase [Streptomyces achromogenes]MCZ0205470.1 SDR family NAD(P)-dependent oxidoreductase [Streptomyces sp. UMAF16]